MIVYVRGKHDRLPSYGYCRDDENAQMWYWKGDPINGRYSTTQYSHARMLELGYRLFEPVVLIDVGF